MMKHITDKNTIIENFLFDCCVKLIVKIYIYNGTDGLLVVMFKNCDKIFNSKH